MARPRGIFESVVTEARANLHHSDVKAPEEIVGSVLAALGRSDGTLAGHLEAQPIPIYMTDADGWVTFFNRACVDFAGRTPIPGRDRWCVTWRLFTENGAPLDHAACPMAVAIRERRRVRGLVAFAERPDGTRTLFAPYPTPILDEEGNLLGAVNILIDLTDRRQSELLTSQAARCRRLALTVNDKRTVSALHQMAEEYELKAAELNQG